MKKTSITLLSLLAALASASAATITYTGPDQVFNADPNAQVLNDGTFVLAMNVGTSTLADATVDTTTGSGSLTFSGGSLVGSTQSLTLNSVTLDITTTNLPTNNFAANAYIDTGLNTLLTTGAASDTADNSGSISISLSGLTVGYEYRLQLFHHQQGVDPTTREMILSNASNGSNNSGVYTYASTASASRMIASWTADAATQGFLLDPSAGIDRSVLNGAALHVTAIPEPSAFALVAVAGLAAVLIRRRRYAA